MTAMMAIMMPAMLRIRFTRAQNCRGSSGVVGGSRVSGVGPGGGVGVVLGGVVGAGVRLVDDPPPEEDWVWVYWAVTVRSEMILLKVGLQPVKVYPVRVGAVGAVADPP